MKDDNDASDYLRSLPRNQARGLAVCTQTMRKVSRYGNANEFMYKIHTTCLQSDTRNYVKHAEKKISEAQVKWNEANTQWQIKRTQYASAKTKHDDAQRKHRKLQKAIAELEDALKRLEAEKVIREVIPEGNLIIEEEKKQLNIYKLRLDDATERFRKVDAAFKEKAWASTVCLNKIQEKENQMAENEKNGSIVEKASNKEVAKRDKAEQKVRSIHRDLLEGEEHLEDGKVELEGKQKELEDLEGRAMEKTGERIETSRTEKEVKKELDILVQLIEEYEEQQEKGGVNEEQLEEQIANAEVKLNNYEKRTKKVCANFLKYSKHLERRGKDCNNMRMETAKSCDSTFRLAMMKRGGEGRLIFDHESREDDEDARFSKHPTLEMEVELHSQKRGQRYSTKQLSGGEATKTQLCFLMAMFRDSASPFHILDEIDVYLDNLQRNKMLKQLSKMARTFDRQWIFLTPHDTSCIERREGVRVQTMSVPED